MVSKPKKAGKGCFNLISNMSVSKTLISVTFFITNAPLEASAGSVNRSREYLKSVAVTVLAFAKASLK